MNLNNLPDFLIGNTPLRKDISLSELFECSVMIKEEFNSPLGMSSKDRVAFYMIKDAIQKNNLKKGNTIVEASSGNTGIGLAAVAKLVGLNCKIYVTNSCSEEKVNVLLNLGATVEKCENSNGPDDPKSSQSKALKFSQENEGAIYTNQYDNKANFNAHYETTGREIWEQTKGEITHFIAGIGTGGTISGIAGYLKEQNKNIKIYGVEPKGSVLSSYFKNKTLPKIKSEYEKIDGIGRNFVPDNFHPEFIDNIFQVRRISALQAVLDYKRETGLLCGISSGAVLEAAIHNLLPKVKSTDKIVLLFPDHGSRYIGKISAFSKHNQLIP